MTEFSQKRERILALLETHNLDALLLQRVSSVAWATCGASSFVNRASTNGEVSLLITPVSQILITNNIEAPRLEQEEGLARQGWELHVSPWYESGQAVTRLTDGTRLGADGAFPGTVDLSADMARLRSWLTPQEGERFRMLGRYCADAMSSAVQAIRPGLSEHQIAALLAQETEARGVQAIVNLVAADDRVFAFRHPLPTARELKRYAMLVLCGRKWGLVCSLTRLVHYGRLPEDLQRKAEAVARIDATLIHATRPGKTLGDVFHRIIDAYAEAGFPDEWKLHHQGGSTGYEPRECLATPGSTDLVSVGQVYAWNPSITGTKSEDSVLVGETKNEVLTSIEGWPRLTSVVDGDVYERPAILQIS